MTLYCGIIILQTALCQILLFVDVLCLLYVYVCVTHCQDQTVVTYSASDVQGQREVTGTLEYPLYVTRPVSVWDGGHCVADSQVSLYFKNSLSMYIIYCREMIKISFNLIAVILIIVNAAIMYLLLYTLIRISNGYRSTI